MTDEMEELKSEIKTLTLQRNAYKMIEEGTKKISDFNKVAFQVGMKRIFPVLFFNDMPAEIREPGIYLEEIQKLDKCITLKNGKLHKMIKHEGKRNKKNKQQ